MNGQLLRLEEPTADVRACPGHQAQAADGFPMKALAWMSLQEMHCLRLQDISRSSTLRVVMPNPVTHRERDSGGRESDHANFKEMEISQNHMVPPSQSARRGRGGGWSWIIETKWKLSVNNSHLFTRRCVDQGFRQLADLEYVTIRCRSRWESSSFLLHSDFATSAVRFPHRVQWYKLISRGRILVGYSAVAQSKRPVIYA